MRSLQLRHLEGRSPVHRMRAEAKIIALVVVSTAVAFNPGWPALALGWTGVVATFLVARLPASILAPPHRALLLPLGVAAGLSLLSGGGPEVGGVELGGLIEFAQLLVFGLLLIAFAALLAWTSSLTDVALGLGRLLRPLRLVGVPHDEISTAVVLAVRSLPAVGAELGTVLDARRTRPAPPPSPDRRRRRRNGLAADAVDLGATVVAAAYRRARDLGLAMVARNSTETPPPAPKPLTRGDVGGVLLAASLATAIFVI